MVKKRRPTGRLFCAQSARLKVSPAFSKAAGSRGGAPGRPPQRAEPPFLLIKDQEGGPRGNPRRGFPLLALTRVRRCVGGRPRWHCPFHPISLLARKETRFWRGTVPNPRCSMRFSARRRLPCPSGRHVRTRAQSARSKVSSTFSKVAGSRGGAPGRPPQRAEPPFLLIKDQEGGPRGKPYQGVSPLFCTLCVCAVAWAADRGGTACSTPFLCSRAKKRGGAPKKRTFVLSLYDSGPHSTPAVSLRRQRRPG